MEKTMETFQMLDTEQCNPATRQIDRLSTLEMVQLINQEDHRCAAAVSRVLPEILPRVPPPGISERLA